MAPVNGLVSTRVVKAIVILPLCAALSGISTAARADNMEDAMQFYDSGQLRARRRPLSCRGYRRQRAGAGDSRLHVRAGKRRLPRCAA